ncbi:dimethyl sulfoxide reductase chain A protein [Yersinia frederiksenii]|nr:dimethyl sulfoxide reductase chain A protein [Yersinia frederiksenii]
MNNNKRPITGSLSRREFIQTSAAVTGAAAIAGSITLPFSVQAAPEQATTINRKGNH